MLSKSQKNNRTKKKKKSIEISQKTISGRMGGYDTVRMVWYSHFKASSSYGSQSRVSTQICSSVLVTEHVKEKHAN